MSPESILAEFSQQQVLGFMLVLARVSPLFLLAPLFSSKMIPTRVRGIVAVALALGIAPMAMNAGDEAAQIPTDVLALGGLVLKEMLVGLGFAFSLGALFAAVQVAGSLLDTLIGFSFGALVDPVTGTNGGVLNQLYALIGVMIFVVIGGDAWVIQGLARSYEAIPLSESPAIGSLVEGAQVAYSGIFASAIEICAPVLIAVVLCDVAFGLVSRVVPQLNVFAVGFPAKVTVGLVLVGASLPFVAGWLGDELQSSVSSALQTLKVAG
jgi:flagellar biosynthetic protein FliR